MKSIDASLALLLAIVVLLHLALAPYTKVEESFNIQAVHDILVYGTPTGVGSSARLAARYDHFAFPGAVPRSFVGAVVLAGISQPFVGLVDYLGGINASATAQIVVRAVLGVANAGAMAFLAASLGRACGKGAARWYLLLQLSQFHCMFYASRTLPNMFAFFLTTLGFGYLLVPQGRRNVQAYSTPGRQKVAISLFVLAGVIFRAEVAILLAAICLYLVLAPLCSVERIVRTGFISAAVGLLLSVPIDTYFWQRPPVFWPELSGFLFNVVNGQASEWGTSPFYYYFVSALPKLLLNPLVPFVLIPLALKRPATQGPARLLVLPSLLFVAVYSLQPHKEARFILYVVPPLTAAAGLGADQLVKEWKNGATAADKKSAADDKGKANDKESSILSTLFAYALTLSVPASFAISTAMLLMSALNYPGGEAMAILRSLVQLDSAAAAAVAAGRGNGGAGAVLTTAPAVVAAHVDVLSCMTGVTLFGSTLGPALPPSDVAMSAKSATAALGASGLNGFPKLDIATTSSSSPPSIGGGSGKPQLLVDKTEDKQVLADPDFWVQFDYVLAEDPKSVGGGGEDDQKDRDSTVTSAPQSTWKTIAVVQGFGGIEVLGPHRKEETPRSALSAAAGSGSDDTDPLVVGQGALVGAVRRLVRSLTGGWYIGPRMVPRIYIMKRIKPPKGSSVSEVA